MELEGIRKMKKIIIVDDEKMIRIGIKNAIYWEGLGISEVLLAAGPREALEMIKQNKPEIMICDINMPEMTGLQLIEKVRTIVPKIKIVMLTGYDKFEYARDSLKLHVDDFFLKPVDEEELTNVLNHLVEKLEEEEKKEIQKEIHDLLNPYQMEKFMRNLVSGKLDKSLIKEFCQKSKIPMQQRLKAIIIVPPLKKREPDELVLVEYEIKDICMGFVKSQEGEAVFSDAYRNIVLILKKNSVPGEFSIRLRQISSVLEMEFGAPPQLFQGETVQGFAELAISYNGAQMIKKENQSLVLNEKYSEKEKSQYQKWEEYFFALKKELVKNLDDFTAVLAAYFHFVDEAKAYNLSSETVARYCFDLVSAVYYRQFENYGDKNTNNLETFLASIQHGEKEDIFLLTRNFIERILDNDEINSSTLVSQAKAYIHEHLTEDVSVANIAANLYVTPNYFSRLFKSVVGIGCNDYIVRKRIQKAENLLANTNMKTGKIAAAVGYNDANYFSLAFKKQIGFSPTQYREVSRKED